MKYRRVFLGPVGGWQIVGRHCHCHCHCHSHRSRTFHPFLSALVLVPDSDVQIAGRRKLFTQLFRVAGIWPTRKRYRDRGVASRFEVGLCCYRRPEPSVRGRQAPAAWDSPQAMRAAPGFRTGSRPLTVTAPIISLWISISMPRSISPFLLKAAALARRIDTQYSIHSVKRPASPTLRDLFSS